MLLSRLQALIGGIYDVSVGYDIYDFLITDRGRLPQEAHTALGDEALIVAAEPAGDGAVGMSLYLDPQLLARLASADPLVRLDAANVGDYWTVLEGVSHFLYVAWNAGHDKPVSLLELEMQAEVDKYVVSYWLMRRQYPRHFPAELRRALFERTHVDTRLTAGPRELYREASRYAERFCRRLEHDLGNAAENVVLAELRRFYRLTHSCKRAHIERTA
ncbi:MAG: hypothetical protein WAU56_18595 [Steroidobacteraceae bacterium]